MRAALHALVVTGVLAMPVSAADGSAAPVAAVTQGKVLILSRTSAIALSPVLILGTARPGSTSLNEEEEEVLSLHEEGGAAAPSFLLAGEPGRAISVALPARMLLRRVNDEEVLGFMQPQQADRPVAATLGENGRLFLRLGAVMVAGRDEKGAYSGTLPVTAQYN